MENELTNLEIAINKLTEEWKASMEKSVNEWTLLHYVSANGADAAVVDALCKRQPWEIKAKRRYISYRTCNCTPLHLAILHGHAEVTKILLKNGADIEAKCIIGNQRIKGYFHRRTPLHLASAHGHVEVVKVLLEKGANIEAEDNERTRVGNGRYSCVDASQLMRQSASKPPDKYRTPLHLACYNDHEEVVKVLVRQGADVNHCSICKRFYERFSRDLPRLPRNFQLPTGPSRQPPERPRTSRNRRGRDDDKADNSYLEDRLGEFEARIVSLFNEMRRMYEANESARQQRARSSDDDET